MKKQLLLLTFFSISLLLTSCKTAYIPNTLNMPLFKEKNEVNLLADYSGNIQAAYALTDHVGIMANYFGTSSSVSTSNGNTTTTTFSNRHRLFEAGAGYFTKISDRATFETYAGAGTGSLYIGDDTQYFNAKTTKFFIQPSIGISSSNDYFSMAFGVRYSNISYGNIKTLNYSPSQLVDDQLAYLGNNSYSFLEPALTFRGGFDLIKLQVQIGESYKLSSQIIDNSSFFIRAGVFFSLAPRYRNSLPFFR